MKILFFNTLFMTVVIGHEMTDSLKTVFAVTPNKRVSTQSLVRG